MQTLSPTKLITYSQCPQAYYLHYHCKVPRTSGRSPLLGTALHRCLARIYQRQSWQGIPSLEELRQCWTEVSQLDPMPEGVKLEGWRILQQYHSQFIAPLQQWCPPLGIEGKIEGSLIVQGLEFRLTGRYDRLDLLDHRDLLTAQIDLIDYKTGHTPLDPQNLALDLQLGIYQIALEQVYGRSLRQLTHIYLRSGQVVRYAANDSQRATLLAKVQDIAMTLIEDRTFTPNPGNHCQRCACRAYCPTQPAPIPLAPTAMGLQLSLLALT